MTLFYLLGLYRVKWMSDWEGSGRERSCFVVNSLRRTMRHNMLPGLRVGNRNLDLQNRFRSANYLTAVLVLKAGE